jgi:hypothetical protein
MPQTCEYNGFTLHVAIQSDFHPLSSRRDANPAYVAVVRICEPGTSRSRFSAIRLAETGGRGFASEAEALSGGFMAAQRMVDDLLC